MDPSTPDPASSSSPEPAALAPRRRGCFGCLFQGGLGCLAFLVGSVSAAGLFAPSLLGGPAAKLLERVLSGRIEGRVAVEDLQLAWNGRQRVENIELFDPDDNSVGSFELSLPGLLTLLDFEQGLWEFTLRVKQARVVIDEDGSSNLSRALAMPSGGMQWDGQVNQYESREGFSQSFPYELHLKGADIELVSSDAAPVHLNDLSLSLKHALEGNDAVTFALEVEQEGERGRLEGSFEFLQAEGPVRGLPWRGARRIDLDAELSELPTATLASLIDAPLAELFGDALSGTLRVQGDAAEGRAVELNAAGDGLAFEGLWKDGLLVGRGPGLTAKLPMPAAWLEQRAAAYLPEGTRLSRIAPEPAPWTLEVTGLTLPMGEPGEPWPTREQLLAGLGGVFELTSPEDVLLVGELDLGGPLVRLDDPTWALTLTPGQAPRLELSSQGDQREVTLRVEGRGDLAQSLDRRDFSVDLDAQGVGVELLDHLRGGDGLLPALFAPEQASLHFEQPLDGPPRLRLLAPDGGVLEGSLVGGELVGGAEDHAVLLLDLNQGAASELVLTLLPWLEGLQRDEGQAPARLVLSEYRLPLRGDLADAEATLRLSLGRVRYRLSPGLYRIFEVEGQAESPTEVQVYLPTTRMRLGLQTVNYDELVVAPRSDEEYDLAGTLHLADGTINLDGELPMKYVRRNAPAGLEDSLFEVNLGGTWKNPSKRIDLRVLDDMRRVLESFGGGE